MVFTWKESAELKAQTRDALKNFGSPWLRPRLLFRNCYWAFVVIDRVKVCAKFEVRSFTRSWDNCCDRISRCLTDLNNNRGKFKTLGRTDRRATYDRNTALCTKVHRAVKSSYVKTWRCIINF